MYEFVNAIICTFEEDHVIKTPMIGYILKNSETGEVKAYTKKEAYYLVLKHGSNSVEAKTRVDEESITRYYLKLKPTFTDKKINEFLVDYSKVKVLGTESYTALTIFYDTELKIRQGLYAIYSVRD